MLLIFGLYVPVITALKEVMHLHLSYFPVIVIFGLGVLTGIALVIKLIRRALENHRSAMIYFVIGMMIGLYMRSLWDQQHWRIQKQR